MCEQTFVACGGCDQPAHELRWVEVYNRTERLVESVDEHGEPCGDGEYEDTGAESELYESYFECPACGWVGHSQTDLDQECVPDYCECRECDEPDPADEPDEDDRDEIVSLVRFDDSQKIDVPADAPPELATLLTDRTVARFPLPRWRATAIHNDWLDPDDELRLHQYVHVDLLTQVSEQLVSELLLPYDDVREPEEDPQVSLRLIEMEDTVGAH